MQINISLQTVNFLSQTFKFILCTNSISFGAESVVFQVAIQKLKDQDI